MSYDLVKQLRQEGYDHFGHTLADETADRIEELKAKLAKAVEALRVIRQFNAKESSAMNMVSIWKMADHAHRTLVEIEGEKE
jgi:hypothetical protein